MDPGPALPRGCLLPGSPGPAPLSPQGLRHVGVTCPPAHDSRASQSSRAEETHGDRHPWAWVGAG